MHQPRRRELARLARTGAADRHAVHATRRDAVLFSNERTEKSFGSGGSVSGLRRLDSIANGEWPGQIWSGQFSGAQPGRVRQTRRGCRDHRRSIGPTKWLGNERRVSPWRLALQRYLGRGRRSGKTLSRSAGVSDWDEPRNYFCRGAGRSARSGRGDLDLDDVSPSSEEIKGAGSRVE